MVEPERSMPAIRRARSRFGLLVAIVTALLAVAATPALGAYIHTTVTGEYGKDGPKASGLGNGCSIAWHASDARIYLLTENKVYGLHRTAPGSVTSVGGTFPFASQNSACGDRDLAVDNSATATNGNIYMVPSSQSIFGYDATGTALASPWPVNLGGETCGVAVDNAGNVWGGVYGGGGSAKKLSPAGAPLKTVNPGFSICKLQVNPANNDLFLAQYGSQLVKYTAASEYATKVSFPGFSGSSNPGLAVNGAENRIYVAAGSSVKAYAADSGALLETITPGGTVRDVAVDESSGTLFISIGSEASGFIQERTGVVVPDVTTGEPTGFATLHGHVALAGGGEATSCKFQYSTSASYPAGPSTGEKPCAPATPYAADQDVTADLTGLVTGEVLYHYRLISSNANGTSTGPDNTFTPHYVAGLRTDPATEVDRKSATLNGSFLGTNEATTFYFKWGPSALYGNTTPVENAGTTVVETPISATLSNVLDPETTYHYRVVATNSQGASEGSDRTFQTKPAVFNLTTEDATNVKTTTADLNASFTGDGLDTTYFFEWGSSSLYGNSTPEGEFTAPSGTTTIPAESIEGLQPLHTYHYRIVATNSFGTTKGPDKTLVTFTAPVVAAQSSANVTATSADLRALLNTHGVDAEYHFEYGPTVAYGLTAPIPDEVIAGSSSGTPVEAHITGLNGGVYHFRVVAKNIYGESHSNDQTFNFYPPSCPNSTVRQQTGANTLPDCRAYELVTPEDAGITLIFPAGGPFSSTAISPSKFGFVGAYGLIDGTGEAANNVGDTYVATRTASGWKTKYVGLPASKTALAGGPPWTYGGLPFEVVSWYEPDKWNLNVLTNPSMSVLLDWNDGYRGAEEFFEAPNHPGSSNAPYLWDTTTGKQVDRLPTNLGAVPGGDTFLGRTELSPDLSHFVFTSDVPFAPGGKPGDLYDNDVAKGTVKIINVNANDEPIVATPVELSDDGSHVLMTVGGTRKAGYFARTNGAGELFMRVGDTTYDIAAGHAVTYLDMTPDGKKVYFTSTEDLTEDSSDPDTSTDLYMWSETSAAPDHLTLISKGNEPSAGNTDACAASWTTKCGIVPISFTNNQGGGYTAAQGGAGGNPYSDNFIAAENGDIYYFSPEQLHGNNGVNGQQNLYVYRNGKNQFVAALDPAGKACAATLQGSYCSTTSIARMEVTPDDSYMAFLTGSKVTGYDNQGHAEMYLYEPGSDAMTCVSCMPSGAPPTADVTTSQNGKFITDDGRPFYVTADALVPQDTNETRDVYEYVEGRPQLITSGTAASIEVFSIATIGALSGLVSVSADGTDVYFATYDVLVGQDRNGEALKVYDARSGGGFAYSPPVPPCVAADECHGAGSTPPATAPSGTGSDLGDVGNIKSGKKKSARKKARHRKKKRKHRKHQRKAQQRRGGRNG